MEKVEKILDMVAYPEHYSVQDFEQMLNDEESRNLYQTMVEANQTFIKDEAEKEQINVDDEWEKFHTLSVERGIWNDDNQKAEVKTIFNMRKIVAIAVIVLFIFGLSYAAIHIIKANKQTQTEQKTETAITKIEKDTTTVKPVMEDMKKTAVHKTFENVSFGKMMQEIADYYGCKLVCNNAKSAQLRLYYEWNSEQGLQKVINELNQFENVSLTLDENTITIE